MSRLVRRMLTTAALGALALTTVGSVGGAASAAAGAPRSMGPPEYSSAWVGYGTSGRWFRYVSTTVTVPPQVVPPSHGGSATVWLNGIGSVVPTQITVAPGGGPVSWGDPGRSGTFRISPRIGDRLTLSIYYDQHGHDYLTATDITRHTTQTVRTNVPKMTYLHARLFAWVYNDVTPPLADTPLWQFTNSRVTTYSGDHGTIVGPWTTSKTIVSTASTASGTVIASPSGLSNGGQDFTAWLRALPSSYNIALAGYQAHGRSFRFISTTLTVPPRVLSKDHLGDAVIALHTSCGSQCQGPFAVIEVLPGGGPGSVQYQGFLTPGNFLVSPRVGDRLVISIYYDQRGRDYFTATDLTQHTTQTVRLEAGGINPVFDWARLSAVVGGTVPQPAVDTRLWQFTGSHLTTYDGVHGTITGPWQTSTLIRTSDGTSTSTVVASPSGLSNGGQDFGVWLRHR